MKNVYDGVLGSEFLVLKNLRGGLVNSCANFVILKNLRGGLTNPYAENTFKFNFLKGGLK